MKRVTMVLSVLGVIGCVPAAGSIAAIPSPTSGTGATDTPEAQSARLERAYAPDRRTDEFTKAQYVDLTIQQTLFDRSVVCSNAARPSIFMTARKFVAADGKRTALLGVNYHASEWLFSDGSLILLVNGQVQTLQSISEPKTDVRTGGNVSESMWFEVPVETLRELSRATELKARLSGRNGRCDFPVGPDARRLLGMFIEREMTP